MKGTFLFWRTSCIRKISKKGEFLEQNTFCRRKNVFYRIDSFLLKRPLSRKSLFLKSNPINMIYFFSMIGHPQLGMFLPSFSIKKDSSFKDVFDNKETFFLMTPSI